MANIVHSIKQAIDLQDPGLVDNTPRLLEVLNTRADRLHKLLVRKDGRGYTLLHLAAERNQPESLKCLLIKEGRIAELVQVYLQPLVASLARPFG